MKARKTSFGLLLALVFTLLLAACGGNNNNGNASPSSSAPASEAASEEPFASASEPAESAAASNDKEFTIRVGAWFIDDRPYQQAFKKSIEDNYKKLYPNAKIQWDITLGQPYFDKLKAQLASASAPDVIFYQTTEYPANGHLADLSGEPWTARLTDAGKADLQSTVKGTTFGLPMGGSIGGGVWYNTAIFDKLGIQPPTTTQEFMDAAEKIKAAGITPIALGFKDVWTAQLFFFNWIQSTVFTADPDYGKKVYDGSIKLDDPLIQSVYQNLQTMKDKGYFNKNALSIDWPQSAQLFAKGEAAMIIQGPWMPGANADNVQKGGFENFQIGFFPFMNDKGDSKLIFGSNTALGVNAKTELMQEAKDMVNLISQPDIYGPFIVGEGALTLLNDVSVTYPDPVMDVVKAAVDKGSLPYRLDTNYMPTSSMNAMVDVVTKVVSGVKFNPEDLKAAQDNLAKDKASVVLP